MKIHVIIPVYNCLKYLSDAVESVLCQTYHDIDIVLIDDGSTDGSSELCDRFAADSNRIAVIHQPNRGVSAARNSGIDHILHNKDLCSEESETKHFIAFLDADDMWCSNVITDNLMLIKQEINDIDIFAFGFVECTEDAGSYSVPVKLDEGIFSGGSEAVWKTPGPFGAKLYNIDLFKKYSIRFDEELKYSEDKIFQMQCVFLSVKIHLSNDVLYIYRKNPLSAMKKRTQISPMEYYIPIINGWIDSDVFLNQLSSRTGKTIQAGHVLASIYFGDMIRDHIKLWKPWKQLQIVKEHPQYYLFVNMKQENVSTEQYLDHNLLLCSPYLYRLKYYIVGAMEFVVRGLLLVKPIHSLRTKMKYPLKSIK